MEVIGDEGVAAPVDGRGRPEDQAQQPDLPISPVGPPARRRVGGITGHVGRGDRHHGRRQQHRQRPGGEGDLPTSAREWQHQRQRQGGGDDLAHQEPVGVGGRGQADALRVPLPGQRGEGRLDDGDPQGHQEGHSQEQADRGSETAQGSRRSHQDQTGDQRPARAQARDQQTARDGEERQHEGRHAGQHADGLLVHGQVAVDQRDQGRHAKHGQAQIGPCHPQEDEALSAVARR